MSQAMLEHVNVTVTDPEKTAALLCELFDWRIRWQGPSQSPTCSLSSISSAIRRASRTASHSVSMTAPSLAGPDPAASATTGSI